jgi:fermentation-respiration switch protein FrsA (DUF1100 family)
LRSYVGLAMSAAGRMLLAAVVAMAVGGCGGGGRAGPVGPSALSLDGFPDFKKARTFNPTRYPQGDWHPAGLAYQDVWFRSADGTLLNGWYVPHENPRAVVLYCHGNSGNLTHRASVLRTLHDQVGVSVFIFDYRGYGRSWGRPSEEGILADARAARAWLGRRASVDQRDIVLLGHALGSGVAVDLAAADGARALVLESAFTSLPDVGASYFPRLPIRLLTRTRLDSYHKIHRYHGPLLQAHGESDQIVPYRLGRRLYLAANEPKEFIALAGHDHMDPLGGEYYARLTEFLDKLSGPEGAAPQITGSADHPMPDEAGGPAGAGPRSRTHATARGKLGGNHVRSAISAPAR